MIQSSFENIMVDISRKAGPHPVLCVAQSKIDSLPNLVN
jgi:hypothetical protein